MTLQELENLVLEIKNQVDEIAKNQGELLSYRQKLRLDNALQGSNTYYVATGPTGPNQTPLTFKDGILDSAS